jgi:DNA-binding NtrC family response regulator
MQGKNIILALSPGRLRDELLLYLGHRGAKAFVTLEDDGIVKLLKTKAIDCLLMQMMLNNKDTIELVFKVHDINKTLPVILIDKTEKDNKKVAEHLKVAAFFKKPVSSFDVYQAIEQNLSKN